MAAFLTVMGFNWNFMLYTNPSILKIIVYFSLYNRGIRLIKLNERRESICGKTFGGAIAETRPQFCQRVTWCVPRSCRASPWTRTARRACTRLSSAWSGADTWRACATWCRCAPRAGAWPNPRRCRCTTCTPGPARRRRRSPTLVAASSPVRSTRFDLSRSVTELV